METLKKVYCFLCGKRRNGIHHGGKVGKSSALRFFFPFRSVAVAVEYDPLMLRSVFFDQVMHSQAEIRSRLQTVAGFLESLCSNGIQYHIAGGDRISRSHHTELKLVSGEGKGGSSVPVCRVLHEIRKGLNACFQLASLLAVGRGSGTDQLLQHVLQLLAQKYGDHSRRSLVAAQAMVVADVSRGFSQKIRMDIHSLEDTGQNKKELDILMGRFARIQKIDAVICGQRPVIVLAGAVQAGEGFLMKEAAHSVAAGHFLEDTHHDLVMVCSDIHRRINRRKFVLRRRHFVMLGLGSHAQFPAFLVYFFHVAGNPLADGSQIVVVHLLPLGRHGAEKRPAGIDQVLPLEPFFFINKEIFLFRSYRRSHSLRCGVAEKAEQTERLGVHRFHGTQQRRLLIQSLACIGTESRGNAQCSAGGVMTHKSRGSAVPGRIPSGFKCRP